MQNKRIAGLLPWLAGLLFLVVFVPTLFQRSFRQDLDILLLASQRLYQGLPVYINDINPHTKPPFLGMIVFPLTLLPKTLLFRVWDLINFMAFFGLALAASKTFLPTLPTKLSVSLLVLFCLNELGGEVRYGQFNLIIYALVYWLFFSNRPFLLGAACVVGVLVKPINIVLFLWSLIVSSKNRKQLLLSASIASLVLVFAYAFFFGWPELIASHRDWMAFVEGPISSKWMASLDGLATFLIQMNWGNPQDISRFVTGLALILSILSTVFIKDPKISFSLAGVLLATLNPIPFKHNYVVLVFFYALAFKALLGSPHRFQKGLLILGLSLSYFSFQIYSPTTFHWAIWSWVKPNTYGFYSTLITLIGVSLSWRKSS